jgi:small subunit ribosomal protein S20
MANIKSAEKRNRQAIKRRARNRAVKGSTATIGQNMLAALEGGDKAKAEALFRTYASVLDKGVKKGIVKANAASRRKSRMALRLKAS